MLGTSAFSVRTEFSVGTGTAGGLSSGELIDNPVSAEQMKPISEHKTNGRQTGARQSPGPLMQLTCPPLTCPRTAKN